MIAVEGYVFGARGLRFSERRVYSDHGEDARACLWCL